MKYLSKIKSISDMENDLEYGVVYYAEEDNEVIIKKSVSEDDYQIVTAKYVIDENQINKPTTILDLYLNFTLVIQDDNIEQVIYILNETTPFLKMRVDNGNWQDLPQLSHNKIDDENYILRNYTFTTSGEHTIEYRLKQDRTDLCYVATFEDAEEHVIEEATPFTYLHGSFSENIGGISIASLVSLKIPSQIKVIHPCAFTGTPLKRLILHEGLEEIHGGIVVGNIFEELTLPSTLKSLIRTQYIGSFMDCMIIRSGFTNNSNLTEEELALAFHVSHFDEDVSINSLYDFPSIVDKYDEESGCVIRNGMLLQMVNYTKIDNCVIPSEVTSIKTHAINGTISNLTLPNNLSEIAVQPFSTSLIETITYKGVVYTKETKNDLLAALSANNIVCDSRIFTDTNWK